MTLKTLAIIMGGLFAIETLALAFAALAVKRQADERASSIEARLAQVETKLHETGASLDQVNSTLDTRLRKAESAVAGQEAKKAARDAERMDLAGSPKKYLRSYSVSVLQFTGGLFGSPSCRIQTALLENRSHFSVDRLRGMWECRGDSGALVAAVPVAVDGTLLPGQKEQLKVSANDVRGYCNEANSKILIDSVAVLGAD